MSQPAPNIDVLLICYNHEKYIQCAVESILRQDYKGDIRVIVADDCSTDATVDMIKKIAAKQSQIKFEFLPNSQNLGITRNYERAFSNCRAEYTAVLEGDDVWESAKKLTKQIAFLEEHRGCVACACNYYVWDERSYEYMLRVQSTQGYLILTSRILIQDNIIGNFSTCVYRTAALQALPKTLFAHTSYDWITNICIAQQGPIGFLNEPLSVYRIHSDGTWSSSSLESQRRAQIDLIPIYDEITGGAFHKEFEALKFQLSLGLSPQSSLILSGKPHSRIKAFVAALCPPLLFPIAQRIYRIVMPKKTKRRLEELTPIRQEPN